MIIPTQFAFNTLKHIRRSRFFAQLHSLTFRCRRSVGYCVLRLVSFLSKVYSKGGHGGGGGALRTWTICSSRPRTSRRCRWRRRWGGKEECRQGKLGWRVERLLRCVGCGPFLCVVVRVASPFACAPLLLRVLYSIVLFPPRTQSVHVLSLELGCLVILER